MKSKLHASRLAAQNESDNFQSLRSDAWLGSGFGIEKGPQSIVTPGPANIASPPHSLASGSFMQDWSNAGLITTSDNWNSVPAIVGYRGDGLTSTDGVDARTVTAHDAAPVVDVNANQTAGTFATGGVSEFDLANDTIGLAGSGTADAPYVVIYLDSTGRQSVRFQCNLRDLDSSADDAVQQINIQYRTNPTGAWTNVTGGYFADVTQANLATLVTAVDVTLPAGANNSATLEIRIMTTNAVGSDEYVGIDDIVVSSSPIVASPGSLAINDPTVVEGDSGTTALTFTVTRSGGSSGAVSADWAVIASETDADDFAPGTLFSGTVNFIDGQTSATIVFNVEGDLEIETNEEIQVTLSNPQGGVTISDTVGLGTVTNDDAAGVFSVADVSVAEGDSGTTAGSFTVTRASGVSGAVTVDYTIALPGGAGNADGTDVSATLTGTVSFAEGETSKTIDFTVNGDRTVETDESFTVTLSNAQGGATISDGTGIATITNDDVAGSVSVADVTLFEGDSGQTMATITLTRTGGSGDFTVDYATSDGSATTADGDYDATSGTAVFTGGATTVTFDVPVNGDTNFETDEAFAITLSNATAGATIGDGSATVTITNDEGAGTVSIGDAQVVEGDSGTVNLVFTLTRSSGTAPFDVTVTTGDDTASDGSDYAANSQVVHFNANETTATFTVTVNGDTDIEGDETLFATLSAPTNGATIGTGTATGTITTDDFPPVGSISIADAQIVEGNAGTSLLVLTVSRTGGTRAFDVNFATANGGDPGDASATAGSDYAAQSGTLSFADGQDSATISITINGDTVAELSEEFTVTLSGVTNGGTLSDASAIGTITNDDVPTGITRIFTESFATFTAGGFAPNPTAGQVDSDVWRVVGLSDIANPAYGFTGAAGTDFGRGVISGDPVTAGVYSVSGAGAMILQPTGAELDINGFIEARIQNTSGGTATSFDVAFDWDYRNNANRGESMQLSYSTDGINFTAVPAADFTTPAALAVGAVFTLEHEGVSLTGLSVANGDFLYLRWTHLSSAGSGSRDEVGIDNVTVDAHVDASLPIVTVSDVSVNEAAGTMTFTVTRLNVTTGSFSIDYATADGTATAGSDYDSASGTLSFGDNQVSATVTVNITDNAFGEADETLFLNLTNAVGANVADAQGIGTILNDDGPPISVSVGDASAVEGQSGTTLMTFTVTRTGNTGAFDIDYATANGTAAAPGDYAAASGTLNFAAGEMSKTVNVTINGDTDSELSETLQLVLSNATNFAAIADGTGIGTIVSDDPIYIHDIQGTAYFSPILAGEGISTFNAASVGTVIVRAVVTAVDNVGSRQGFYLQEELADWDANPFTSEGIFVMTRNDAGVGSVVSGVNVGDIVTVTAHVMEYQGFTSTMPISALTSPSSIVVNSSGNALPAFTLGAMPTAIMTLVQPDYTDSSDGVGDSFDASLYALSYWETVEGMLVTVPDVVVADGFYDTSGGQPFFQAYSQSLTDADQINSRGGLTIAGDPPIGPPDTPGTEDDTTNGGRALTDGDINPDLIEIDFTDFAIDAPAGLTDTLSMGDYLGDVTGIVDFSFFDRKLMVTDIDTGSFVDHTTTQETTALGNDDRALTVATFNVENLDPGDDPSRFTEIANAIANNLNAPDIICIEEMQDNNGAAAGSADASTTWGMLVAALNAATGKTYQWVDQEPINSEEGGEADGDANIRVGFLYDTDRVQLGNLEADATLAERRMYTDRIGDGARDSGDLIAFDDSMLGSEIQTADWSNTRRSLLGEFTFHGNTVYVTANHWPAKSGSDQFWHFNQNPAGGEPTNADWTQRNAVAQDVYAMLNHIETNAASSGIVSGGDFNDFYFYRPLTTLTGHTMADGTARVGGARFDNLTLTLAEAERYTYNFDGRSQAIDHIIANSMLGGVATYDIVHLNTGFNPGDPTPLSDHDPGLASFDFRNFGELLIGTGDAETIIGYGGDDILIGNGQVGSSGPWDTLFGGTGNDIYRAENPNIFIVESVGEGFDAVYAEMNYALRSGQEIELLSYINPLGLAIRAGGNGVSLNGNEFAQTIIGSAGDDGIIGEGGNDIMSGGAGNDGYRVQQAGDVVLEYAGGGTDSVYVDNSLGSYTLQAGYEIEILAAFSSLSTTALSLTGNGFANTIVGSAGADTLIGGGGNDTLQGLNGNDTYRIDDLGDIVVESVSSSGGALDRIYVAMSVSGYVLDQQCGVELLSAIDTTSTQAFDLTGNLLAQTIIGTAGANVLIGGGGADVLSGLGGDDLYRVEASNAAVLESAGGGFDAIYVALNVSSYALRVDAEVELVSAIDPSGNVAMNLTGNDFANTLVGTAGANVLNGGAGEDGLFGGGGADTFAFTARPQDGNDTILDFEHGVDKIALDDAAYSAIGGPGALNANAFVIGAAAGDADDRIIYDSATGHVFYDADGSGAGAAVLFATLTGTPTLAASDFVVI